MFEMETMGNFVSVTGVFLLQKNIYLWWKMKDEALDDFKGVPSWRELNLDQFWGKAEARGRAEVFPVHPCLGVYWQYWLRSWCQKARRFCWMLEWCKTWHFIRFIPLFNDELQAGKHTFLTTGIDETPGIAWTTTWLGKGTDVAGIPGQIDPKNAETLNVLQVSLELILASGWFMCENPPKKCHLISQKKTAGALKYYKLGGGFKYFLCSPLFGEDSHFD